MEERYGRKLVRIKARPAITTNSVQIFLVFLVSLTV
jgi:hypothetical protein